MIIYDKSSYSNDGEIINFTKKSLIKSSLQGNYSNLSMNCYKKEYAIINNSEQFNFDINNSFSISTWFKTKINSGASVLVSKINKRNVGYEIVLDGTSGKIIFELINKLSKNHMRIDTVNSFNDDNWHHLLVTWDSNVASIFIDGIKQTHNIICDNLSESIMNKSNFQIGSKNKGASLWQGMINDVAIYNTKLTLDDAILMYNKGIPISLNFLANKKFMVGYWDFEEQLIKKINKRKKYYIMTGYDPEKKIYHTWKTNKKPTLSADPRYNGKLINIYISAIL